MTDKQITLNQIETLEKFYCAILDSSINIRPANITLEFMKQGAQDFVNFIRKSIEGGLINNESEEN